MTKDVLKSRNPGCLRQTGQLVPAKLNPVYGRFSKGGRNEAKGKFSHLILDHSNDCQPLYAEVGWVLVSSGTEVQPQIILDPNYLSVSYDHAITVTAFKKKYQISSICFEDYIGSSLIVNLTLLGNCGRSASIIVSY